MTLAFDLVKLPLKDALHLSKAKDTYSPPSPNTTLVACGAKIVRKETSGANI